MSEVNGRKFDNDAAEKQFFHKKPWLCFHECVHSYTEGARWQFDRDSETIEKLQAENERLRAALEFYANNKNMQDKQCCNRPYKLNENELVCCGFPATSYELDAGNRARQALNK